MAGALGVVLTTDVPTSGQHAQPVYVDDSLPIVGPSRACVLVSAGEIPALGGPPLAVRLAPAGTPAVGPALPVYVVPGGGYLDAFVRLKELAAGGYYYDGIYSFTGASGAIASWAPVVGANAAVQGTGANQPTVGTLNSRPAAVFDGTNDVLQTAAFAANISPPYTVLCVYQRTGATGGTSRVIHDGIAAGNRAAILHQGSDDKIQARGSLAIGGNLASSLNPAITRVVYNGASSRIYLNGVADTVGDAGTSVLTGITLGCTFNGTSGQFPGSIAAYMLIPNTADGGANAIEAETLLRSRYGF